MLRKKPTKFAPKAIRRPGAGSEPSSARPSVERQSQTPAPTAQPEEHTSNLPNDTSQAATEEQAIEPTQAQPAATHAPISFENATPHETPASQPIYEVDTPHRDTPILDAIPELHTRQLPTPESSTIDGESMTDEPANDTSDTASAKTLKRKAGDEEPPQSEHIQKRQVIEAQSSNTPLHTPDQLQATLTPVAPVEQSAAPSGQVDEPQHFQSDIGRVGGEPASNLGQAEDVGSGATSIAESPHGDLGPDGVRSVEGQVVQGSQLVTSAALNLDGTTGIVAPVIQASQLVPLVALNPDGTTDDAPQEAAKEAEKPKKKKTTKRKKIQAAEGGDDARATIDMQINRPRRVNGSKRSRKKKDGDKRKKRRGMTPDGAEEDVVDHSTMKMSDLCKDLRIGKRFSKHDEIKQRVVQKKVKAKLAKTHPELISLLEGEGQEGDGGQAQPDGEGEASEPAPPAIPSGPQMRVVDGQIVLDDSSLQIDRHKRAQAENVEMEEVEENEFTRITTSGTFMKRERAQLWDHAATDMFYRGLRMFGTDFEMIAKMFPHRNRRQIKLKFNKEERNNLSKINRALIGEKDSIDLDEYEVVTGLKLEEVADIEAERDRIEAEQVAAQEKHAAEAAETARKKKADIQAKSDAAKRILATADEPTGDSAKENEPAGNAREASAGAKGKKKAAPKRKKKNPHSSRGGGEEVEVLGSIET